MRYSKKTKTNGTHFSLPIYKYIIDLYPLERLGKSATQKRDIRSYTFFIPNNETERLCIMQESRSISKILYLRR